MQLRRQEEVESHSWRAFALQAREPIYGMDVSTSRLSNQMDDQEEFLQPCDSRRGGFLRHENKVERRRCRSCRDLITLPLSFFLILLLLLLSGSSALGATADGNVTLVSLTIFQTHEWVFQPDVYFKCQGEERKYLPDVKDKDHLYKFVGQESWQPLTTLNGTKCKRCGLYEKDTLKSDDIFDEWELCPLDFSLDPEVHYFRFKDKEFNMTLSCPQCYVTHPQDKAGSPDSPSIGKGASTNWILAVLIIVVGVLCMAGLALVAYRLWRRKVRKEAQARFVQLFEDDDFLEEELDLKDDL